jgi:hypothetical protein
MRRSDPVRQRNGDGAPTIRSILPTGRNAKSSATPTSRGDWIRTSDPLTPRPARAFPSLTIPQENAPSGDRLPPHDSGFDDLPPRSAAASAPSDAELERAIVDAVRMGLGDVARTIAACLDERHRAAVPANIVELDRRREQR